MSLIRIAVPGQPVILVDEGPNTGRTSFSRGAVSGGAIVTTPSWRDRLNQQTREYKQREAEKARERRAAQ